MLAASASKKENKQRTSEWLDGSCCLPWKFAQCFVNTCEVCSRYCENLDKLIGCFYILLEFMSRNEKVRQFLALWRVSLFIAFILHVLPLVPFQKWQRLAEWILFFKALLEMLRWICEKFAKVTSLEDCEQHLTRDKISKPILESNLVVQQDTVDWWDSAEFWRMRCMCWFEKVVSAERVFRRCKIVRKRFRKSMSGNGVRRNSINERKRRLVCFVIDDSR